MSSDIRSVPDLKIFIDNYKFSAAAAAERNLIMMMMMMVVVICTEDVSDNGAV